MPGGRSSIAGNSATAAAIDYVRTVDPSVMSAMTIFPDWPLRHRVIIVNDANTAQRRAGCFVGVKVRECCPAAILRARIAGLPEGNPTET